MASPSYVSGFCAGHKLKVCSRLTFPSDITKSTAAKKILRSIVSTSDKSKSESIQHIFLATTTWWFLEKWNNTDPISIIHECNWHPCIPQVHAHMPARTKPAAQMHSSAKKSFSRVKSSRATMWDNLHELLLVEESFCSCC